MTVLYNLKDLIKQQGFADEQEEIYFYKHTNPKFHALYIYHATVFSVESDKPLGSKKASRRYFHNEMRKIDIYFYHNAELYRYYRSDKIHLDKEYFIRGQGFNNGFVIDIVTPIIDREFCTLHSIKIAFLIAYRQLREYFQNAMLEMDTPVKKTVFGPEPDPIIWTDVKTGLIELIYSLHAKGSFNHGKADLTKIIEHLEKSFQVDLGNTSRTFQEILSRKKGYTTFLDKLKSALLKRMMADE
jgi:hypothetical protein